MKKIAKKTLISIKKVLYYANVYFFKLIRNGFYAKYQKYSYHSAR